MMRPVVLQPAAVFSMVLIWLGLLTVSFVAGLRLAG